MDATQSLEKLIQDLEEEQARRGQLLSDLRAALAKARNGTSATPSAPSRKAAVGVFQRKYDVNARELTARILRSSRKPLHIGQIQDLLMQQGYKFIKATISASVKQLEKEKKVRQVKAPSGSGYSHAYVWVSERPSGEVEQQLKVEGF